jgi:hypothetical protein
MRNTFTALIFLAILCGAVNVSTSSAAPVTAVASAMQAAPAAATTDDATKKDELKSLGEAWGGLKQTQRTQVGMTGLAILLLVLAIFGVSSRSEILRGSYPVHFGGATKPDGSKYRRPFSLAQCQMMWWFVLVFVCYIFILWTKGDYNSITTQVLTLMGIGTGTALGAAMIDQTKSTPNQDAFQAAIDTVHKFDTTYPALSAALATAAKNDSDAQAELDAANSDPSTTPAQRTAAAQKKAGTAAALTAAQGAANTAQPGLITAITVRDRLAPKLASENLFTDILSDVSGISLHRFQSFAWTLVLGGVFVAEVAVQGKFPEFEATELALLGIASGVYLGFKVPEQAS